MQRLTLDQKHFPGQSTNLKDELNHLANLQNEYATISKQKNKFCEEYKTLCNDYSSLTAMKSYEESVYENELRQMTARVVMAAVSLVQAHGETHAADIEKNAAQAKIANDASDSLQKLISVYQEKSVFYVNRAAELETLKKQENYDKTLQSYDENLADIQTKIDASEKKLTDEANRYRQFKTQKQTLLEWKKLHVNTKESDAKNTLQLTLKRTLSQKKECVAAWSDRLVRLHTMNHQAAQFEKKLTAKQDRTHIAASFVFWKNHTRKIKHNLLKKEFFTAIERSDLLTVNSLLPVIKASNLINECNDFGYSPLLLAINRGDKPDTIAMVENLLTNGANPNQFIILGGIVLTPLRAAIAWLAQSEIFYHLIQNGANVNLVSPEDKMTPLGFGLCNLPEKQIEVISTLLKQRPKIDEDETLHQIILPQLKSKKPNFYKLVVGAIQLLKKSTSEQGFKLRKS